MEMTHEIKQKVVDGFLDDQVRLESLKELSRTSSVDYEEMLSTISSLFFYSGVSSLRSFMELIMKDNDLPLPGRVEYAKYLRDFDFLTHLVSDDMDRTILELPVIAEIVFLILNATVGPRPFSIVRPTLDATRFGAPDKLIFLKRLKTAVIEATPLLLEAYQHMAEKEKGAPKIQILCLQALVELHQGHHEATTELLLGLAADTSLPETVRADALDVALTGAKKNKRKDIQVRAQTQLERLGSTPNFYQNKQNVHLLDTDAVTAVADQIVDQFGHLGSLAEVQKALTRTSLTRVQLDTTTYGSSNWTLEKLLCAIYAYIQTHKDREALSDRLVEELEDAADTCSSGYLARIVNVLFGFDNNFTTKTVLISSRRAVITAFGRHLNRLLQTDPDTAFVDRVLEEITLPSDRPETRKSFLKFLRQSLPIVYERLGNEFAELGPADFDLFFRDAILAYEGEPSEPRGRGGPNQPLLT